MSWFRESQDYLPLTWWKGRPVYLVAVLALVGGVSMIVALFAGPALGRLVFSYENLLKHHFFWTPLTYALVNPFSLWTAIGLFFLWRFGEPVERHLGRRAFVRLGLIFLAAAPLLMFLLGLFGVRAPLAGMDHLSFGVFLAFAVLYPRVQVSMIIVTVEVWVIAAIFVAVRALSNFNATGLSMLAMELAVAYGFIRHEQGQLKMPSLSTIFPRAAHSRPHRSPSPPRPSSPKRTRRSEPKQPEVDDILDKISREGMHSLTPDERVILDRASHDLQKRKQ